MVDIALKNLGREVKDEMFINPTAVVFAKEDMPTAAKVISEAAKKNDKIKIKGGYMGADLLDSANVEVVANIPQEKFCFLIWLRLYNRLYQVWQILYKALYRNLLIRLILWKKKKRNRLNS